MISKYKFEEVENQNSFEHGVSDFLYFPVTDSEDFPQDIREKTEQLIDHIIYTHKLDLSKLRLHARVIVCSDKNDKWSNEISVVIADNSAFDDTWIEEEYTIGHDDPLYVSLKSYVMKKLGEILFDV